MSTQVKVTSLPNCDFCDAASTKTTANYDGRTTFGAWAFMCDAHFQQYGVGVGTGHGQKLVTA